MDTDEQICYVLYLQDRQQMWSLRIRIPIGIVYT